MIALLCPSKGRPEKLKIMWESAKATSSVPLTLYLAISEADYPVYSQLLADNAVKYVDMPELMPTAQKWNYLSDLAIEQKDTKIFFLAGDDMIFNDLGWDKAIIDHYQALENKIHVYHLQDSRDRDAIPHPIMTREYIEAMGYFVPPIFLHWFIDTWTTEIAKSNNCFTHLRDYLLIHDKDNDKGKPDLTHTGIRGYGWRDRDGYVDEHCKHFLELEKKRLSNNMKFGFGKGLHPFEDVA